MLLFQIADASRHGYRDQLAAFWDDARTRGVELPPPDSAPAFCQARAKLAPAAMLRVAHEVGDSFDRVHGERFRWKGRRLVAIDGSSLQLQRSKVLFDRFGSHRLPRAPFAIGHSTLRRPSGRAGMELLLEDARKEEQGERNRQIALARPCSLTRPWLGDSRRSHVHGC